MSQNFNGIVYTISAMQRHTSFTTPSCQKDSAVGANAVQLKASIAKAALVQHVAVDSSLTLTVVAAATVTAVATTAFSLGRFPLTPLAAAAAALVLAALGFLLVLRLLAAAFGLLFVLLFVLAAAFAAAAFAAQGGQGL